MSNLGYCRMCAEIKQCFNLIMISKNEPTTDVNTNLSYKIFQCFQIKVLAEDNLPKTVCFDCSTQIDHIYEFYQKVQKAQEFLSNIVFNPTLSNSFPCNYDDYTASNDSHVEGQIIPKVEITEASSYTNKATTRKKFTKKTVRKRACIWTCHKCELEFEVRKDLDKHFQDVHDETPEYKCPKCPKSFTVHYSYTRHLRLHRNQDRFRCFMCPKTYSDNSTLRMHLKSTHKQDLKKVCTACGIVYKRPQLLEQHIKKFHKSAQKKQKHECDICKKKVFNLSWHKKTHEAWKAYTWKCEKCQLVYQKNAELVKHCREVHDEQPEYKCPKCGKCFRKYENFLAHLRVHRDRNKFRCNICDKTYSEKRGLRRHVYENHELNPLVKPKCTICGKSFKNPRWLQIHQKNFHTGIKKVEVECDICHRKLANKVTLRIHKKTHDESTKCHICDQCGARFRFKSMLKYHIDAAHTVMSEEDYLACPLCPSKFKTKKQLRAHNNKIHAEKRFECDLCGKKYSERARLTEHMRLHTGERPFECEYCKKTFRMKPHLKIHLRQHTGEKPYHCAECNHSFADCANYAKHRRQKHGIGNALKRKDGTNGNRQRNSRRKSKEQPNEVEPEPQQPVDRSACMQRMLDVYPIPNPNAYTRPTNIVYPKPNNMYPNMHGLY